MDKKNKENGKEKRNPLKDAATGVEDWIRHAIVNPQKEAELYAKDPDDMFVPTAIQLAAAPIHVLGIIVDAGVTAVTGKTLSDHIKDIREQKEREEDAKMGAYRVPSDKAQGVAAGVLDPVTFEPVTDDTDLDI